MPPKFKFTREEIVTEALNLTRESGLDAVTSRGLAARLGASAKPIFGLFKNMEEVHRAVFLSAYELYQSYLQEDMSKGEYPPYKASGMAYIRFARDERELFKLLFMRDRSQESIEEDKEQIRPLLDLIKQNLGLNEENAYLFHLEMWVYVHGIATMIATSYLDWEDKFISKIITDAYTGLKYRYQEISDDAGERGTGGSESNKNKKSR